MKIFHLFKRRRNAALLSIGDIITAALPRTFNPLDFSDTFPTLFRHFSDKNLNSFRSFTRFFPGIPTLSSIGTYSLNFSKIRACELFLDQDDQYWIIAHFAGETNEKREEALKTLEEYKMGIPACFR